jgi:hypothetical protein
VSNVEFSAERLESLKQLLEDYENDKFSVERAMAMVKFVVERYDNELRKLINPK